jgi:hypothetical protein
MLTAPIIHARTLKNDFPGTLLAAPQGFTPEDTAWARKYILQSTRYLEFSKSEGRRLIFCSKKLLVTGLTIHIRDLYALCGKEPRYDTLENRDNYAFIGFAIPKSEITAAFDIPYSVFLDLYESFMEKLWDLPFSETGLPTAYVPYRNMEFPRAKEVYPDIPKPKSDKVRYILDAGTAPLDSIAARAVELMLKQDNFSFCSDIPNIRNVLDGDLRIVTSYSAATILQDLQEANSKSTGIAANLKAFWDSVPSWVKKGGKFAITVGTCVLVFLLNGQKNKNQ